MDEYTEEEIQEAVEEDRCLFALSEDEEAECLVHHSYESSLPRICLWAFQHTFGGEVLG